MPVQSILRWMKTAGTGRALVGLWPCPGLTMTDRVQARLAQADRTVAGPVSPTAQGSVSQGNFALGLPVPDWPGV